MLQDDGGFPITGYKIDMLDIQTNNWLEITFIEVGVESPLKTPLASRASSHGAPCPTFSTASCTDLGNIVLPSIDTICNMHYAI